MEVKETQKPMNPDLFFERMMLRIGSKSSLIIHTIFFVSSFLMVFLGVSMEKVLLVVTTLVSLEAIYLAIFIQMAVNRNTESLEEVEENIDEIQEDVQGMEKDIDEIQEDIDEIQEDVDEIEKEEAQEETREKQEHEMLNKIEAQLQALVSEIDKLKKS